MGWVCREVVPTGMATSGPCFSHWCLPRQVGTGWGRQGGLGWPGRGIRGHSHCLLTAQREERSRRQQSCASCLATPLQISILSENIFFQRFGWVFTGSGSGLDDQVVSRNHTLYPEGPRWTQLIPAQAFCLSIVTGARLWWHHPLLIPAKLSPDIPRLSCPSVHTCLP